MSVANASGLKVDELEREVEQSRDQVSHTLDELQSQVSGTIDEWKHRLTAEEISKEVKTYVADSGRKVVSNLSRSIETRLRENPASVVAMGAIAAWPVYRIARKIPLPVYLMGAGVALMKPMGRAWEHGWDAFADLTPPNRTRPNYGDDVDMVRRARGEIGGAPAGLRQRVDRGFEQISDTAARMSGAVAGSVSGAAATVTSTAQDAYGTAGQMGSTVAGSVADAAATVGSTVQDAYDATAEFASDLPRRASAATARAGQVSRQAAGNPLVIGLLGVAGAAAVAAMLPRGAVRRGGTMAARATTGAAAGARAAVERAYDVAVQEALASGASLGDAEETARAFVARMMPRNKVRRRKGPNHNAN